nr:tetratricopeptide-like helical domain, DYW domain protein [Tanacetum cinerariifolium]
MSMLKKMCLLKKMCAKKDMSDEDNLADHWRIYYLTTKWKLMRLVLGEKFKSFEQLKRALVFYALANRYKLYYEVNNPKRLLAECCEDEKDRKCLFRKKYTEVQYKNLFWKAAWQHTPQVSSRGRWDGSKSRMYPSGIRPFEFGVSWDPINGQTMLGNSMGLFRHVWPEGITPQDCIIHAATQSEIALSQSVGISLYVTTLTELPFVIILSYTRARLDD